MIVEPLTASSYQALLSEGLQRAVVNAIGMYASMPVGDLSSSTAAIIAPLTKSVTFGFGLDEPLFIEYLNRIIDRMNNEGAGADFRNRDQFMADLRAAIDRLQKQGQPTSNLWLALARYYGLYPGFSDARRVCIEKAIDDSSLRNEDLIRALLALAELHIEASMYPEGSGILDRCEELALSGAAGSRLSALIIAQRGIIHFYDNHKRALQYFSQVSVTVATHPDLTRDENRALALANHFSGRILAARGHYVDALRCLALGQSFKEKVAQEHKQLGFYNLRLGEILLNLGETTQAKYHFEQCDALFRRMQERGSAKAQLDAAVARAKAKEGDVAGAQRFLRTAIDASDRDGFQRGKLKYLVDLGRLQMSNGQFMIGASTLLSVAGMAVKGQHRESIRMLWLFVRDSLRLSMRRGQRTDAEGAVRCPCEYHRSTTERQLGATEVTEIAP